MMSDLQLMELEDELKSVDTFLEHLKTEEAQTLFHQDLFHSFEAMKTAAPGMSRQAFTAMLDQRTKQYGRTGKVNADAFQRSFLQFVYCNYEENQLLGNEPLVCPACSPEMVAVSVDGNRKLYRFQKTNQPQEKPCLVTPNGMQQERLQSGPTSWMKKVWKLLCVDMDFFSKSATFLAMDVTCRYVPYLTKVSEALTHLQPLQEMRHCLSVMHAKAHNTKCEILWTARNQEGAGTTLGEEVEQVNSFLSRCALTTKYMAKSVRTDMLTVHAMGWNERKENGLHIALSSRFKKTVEKTVDVAESLKTMQEQLHCCDDML
ncbi:uncharacterized protein LOC124477479 isoform X4 [Hypomesus transpacificus]|uniref:uncharacterized protein LOC124477479 isoform X4 n=1 Tax=Hypomesus transpacificus TaxID=137520 RepID=UPI001F0828FF|nr:uncharacterized protein LOC124477479 isoform X4 [Hypomesus transpacificus]